MVLIEGHYCQESGSTEVLKLSKKEQNRSRELVEMKGKGGPKVITGKQTNHLVALQECQWALIPHVSIGTCRIK